MDRGMVSFSFPVRAAQRAFGKRAALCALRARIRARA